MALKLKNNVFIFILNSYFNNHLISELTKHEVTMDL